MSIDKFNTMDKSEVWVENSTMEVGRHGSVVVVFAMDVVVLLLLLYLFSFKDNSKSVCTTLESCLIVVIAKQRIASPLPLLP